MVDIHRLAKIHDLHPSKVVKALFFFFLPFLIASAFILTIYAMYPSYTHGPFPVMGGGMALYFFPPAGKETVIPVMVTLLKNDHGFSALQSILAGTITIAFTDIVTGLFLLWNFDFIVKVPFFGPIIVRMEEKGHEYLKDKSWVRKLAFIGVVLFVIFPFQGSGGVGGTIMGRLVGLDKRKVWYAVSTGAISGCFMISTLSYYFGDTIISAFKSPGFRWIGAVFLVIVIEIIIYGNWRKRKSKAGTSEDDSEDDSGEDFKEEAEDPEFSSEE